MNLSKKSRNMMFAVLLTGSIISSLLYTALTTALPAIIIDLNISAATAQWLTSAYSLAMGIMVPATAFFIKRFSTKQLFIVSMSIFAVGVLLSANAATFPILLAGRILQAMGNGVLMSMTQVVILTIYPVEQRGSIMGIYGLAGGAAPVFAPTLAGIVIDIFNWRAIFWFAFVIALLSILAAVKVLQNVGETEKQRFDMSSMILCALGFTGLLLGLGNMGTDRFLSINIGLPLLIGIVALAVFCLRQLRLETPFLELRILQNRDFRVAVIIGMLLYAVMIAGSTLIPIYIQLVRGFSATRSGLIMMPGALIMALISPFTGKFYDKYGIRKLAVWGSAFLAISSLGLAFLENDTSSLYIALFHIVRLVAVGFIMMPTVTWGMHTLSDNDTAHGTALLTTLRTIAGSFGSAVFVALMTSVTAASSDSTGVMANVSGMNVTFLCISLVAVVQFVIALLFVGKKKKGGAIS